MTLVQLIEYARSSRHRLLRRLIVSLIVLDVLDTLPLMVDKQHAHTWMELIPGFWTLFGVGGCIGLILLSKGFGHLGIMTREDYYDE